MGAARANPPDPRIGSAGLIIFDGACGACSYFIGERKAFFARNGFTVAPLQEVWTSKLSGVPEQELEKAIHLLTPSGALQRGPDFFAYVAATIWWLAPFGLLLKIPACKRIFGKIYERTAANRQRISKSCGLSHRAMFKK